MNVVALIEKKKVVDAKTESALLATILCAD